MKRGLGGSGKLRRGLAALGAFGWMAACTAGTVDQSSGTTGGGPDGGQDAPSGPLPPCSLVPDPHQGYAGCVYYSPCPATQVCCLRGCVPGDCSGPNSTQGCVTSFTCVEPSQCQKGGSLPWMGPDGG